MSEEESKQFHSLMEEALSGKDPTAYPMSQDLFNDKLQFVKKFASGTGTKLITLQKTFPQAYRWAAKYDSVFVGNQHILVYREQPDSSGNLPPLDRYKKVGHQGNAFENISAVHVSNGAHRKARTLHDACKVIFGKSYPQWLTDILCGTCAICICKSVRKKPKAGHQPIISKGFGSRGQIDLIDMQSMPDGLFKYILNYTDHGSKMPYLFALSNKEVKCVSYILFRLFTMIGPPAILQADNGREFNGMACNGKANKIDISDEVITILSCGAQLYSFLKYVSSTNSIVCLLSILHSVCGQRHILRAGIMAWYENGAWQTKTFRV